MKASSDMVYCTNNSFYVIAAVGNSLKERIEKAVFKLPKDAVLKGVAESLSEFMVSNSKRIDSLDEYIDICCGGEKILCSETIQNIFEIGMNVFVGFVSKDSNNPFELLLCPMIFNYESDDLVILKEIKI